MRRSIALATWIIVFLLTRFVSVGSLAAAVALPTAVWLTKDSVALGVMTTAGLLTVLYKVISVIVQPLTIHTRSPPPSSSARSSATRAEHQSAGQIDREDFGKDRLKEGTPGHFRLALPAVAAAPIPRKVRSCPVVIPRPGIA